MIDEEFNNKYVYGVDFDLELIKLAKKNLRIVKDLRINEYEDIYFDFDLREFKGAILKFSSKLSFNLINKGFCTKTTDFNRLLTFNNKIAKLTKIAKNHDKKDYMDFFLMFNDILDFFLRLKQNEEVKGLNIESYKDLYYLKEYYNF